MTDLSPSYLQRSGAADLAYCYRSGKASLPTVLFLCGFNSDMTGTKAQYLDALCERRGQGCLRFDYSGHGRSSGTMMEGTIGGWLGDALAVIDAAAEGPLLLVGSSMGGWLALLAALARGPRVAALIGLAAAPDFTRLIRARLGEAEKAALAAQGYFTMPSGDPGRPHICTNRMLEESAAHFLLDGPIAIECPVRLVQGKRDREVPWQTAEALEGCLTSADKKLHLLEDSDHRLSSDSDLALLGDLVEELSAACT